MCIVSHVVVDVRHTQDGEMKVYRRSAEEGGVTCDKLKAFHSFKGVTAKVCMHIHSLTH